MPTAVSVAVDLTTSPNVGVKTRGVENDRRKGGRGTVKVSGKGKGLTGTLKKQASTTVVGLIAPPELLIAADYAAAVSAVAREDGNTPSELVIAAASAAASAVASEYGTPPAAVFVLQLLQFGCK
jgi:hypothetical protein